MTRLAMRWGTGTAATVEGAFVVVLVWTIGTMPVHVTTADPFVRRLPCVIVEPGTYRLERSLDYFRSGGSAIRILANDVTLDMAGHEIRCRSLEPDRSAIGVEVDCRSRCHIANGGIVDFPTGVRIRDVDRFDGAAPRFGGHVVRGLDLHRCLQFGVRVHGNECRIEGNVIRATGPFLDGEYVYGIETVGERSEVRRNLVWNTVAAGEGEAVGISFTDVGTGALAADNVVVNAEAPGFRSIAVWVGHRSNVRVVRNLVHGFTWGVTYSSTTRGRYAANVVRDCATPICLSGVDHDVAAPSAPDRWVDEGGNDLRRSGQPVRMAERE